MSGPPLGRILLDLAEGVPYRRSTRLLWPLPLTVSGKDQAGRPLQEITKTLDIGKHGVRIATLSLLPAKAEIDIRNGSEGKKYRARVVWRGARKTADDRTETGIEFLQPFDVDRAWAISVPPDDWRKGSLALTTAQKVDYFNARDGTFRLRRQQKAPANDAELPPLPMLPDLPPLTDEVTSASSRGATRLPECVEPIGAKGDHPFEVPPPAKVASVEAGCDPSLLPLIRPGPVEVHLKKAADRPVQPPNPPTGPPPNGSVEELMSRIAQILNGQADNLSKSLEDAVGSVQTAGKAAVTELQAARKQMDESLQATFAEYQRQLRVLAASSGEELRPNSEALLESIRGDLEKALSALDEKAAQEVRYQLGKMAASLRDEFSGRQREQEQKYQALERQIEDYTRDSFRMEPRRAAVPPSPKSPWVVIGILAALATAATALCGFVYLSTQPVMQLRAEPPAEFIEPDPRWNNSRRVAEERIARAYWAYAAQNLPPTYTYDMKLPERPPPEFKFDPTAAVETHFRPSVEATRTRYWQKLRAAWDKPQAWERSYNWNTAWIGARLKPFGETLRNLLP